MTRYLVVFAILAALVLPTPLWCADTEPTVPVVKHVDPVKVKVGAVVTVEGEALAEANVEQVFLTKDGNDVRVQILSQSKTQLKFRVPASMAPAKYSLTILTAGTLPMLLEQPVFLVVEK